MSYARFSANSDIYLYGTSIQFQEDATDDIPMGQNCWECCGCLLSPRSAHLPTIGDVYMHLLRHRRRGHRVPEYALRAVTAEMQEHGPEWVW
ncbi:MAG: hypothetical protein ACYSUV_21455 [Planctomycetota bacterium]|jgi:hypothetical protein